MKPQFIYGADISFLDEIEVAEGKFYDESGVNDALTIMSQNGINSIRLRIWNDPDGGYCNLKRTLHMAKRIKEKGMHLLLCFHYSDVWADPKHQTKPKAWEALDYPALKQALYEYTHDVVQALQDQGTPPDMVQIGNEITFGIVWDTGSVNGELGESEEQWNQFTELMKTGISAVNAIDPAIEVMVHIDQGGKNDVCRRFLDRFEQLGVEYDTLGLSFYPWWHGTLMDLEKNMADLITRYNKDIVVVEMAYPWTLDTLGPVIIVDSEEKLHEGYPATEEGQAAYMQEFIQLLKRSPNNRCKGFHYWEPCWIPCKQDWSVGHPNNWSNLTLFDYEGRKLKALEMIKTAVES
ncbi:glycoside hydrolase family 53 protein [Paenibacillus lemnae]|uniref:Arabinogalactan endo-beta-1,4-galactanase n=1 Tax=Paenibacillus lemnae TaxID=1330551 RepID=A0A848MDU4_PAELE|nr:glycosyl hydrolase 53 family protein [Paenibacillus lemnae]NMO98222.1 antitoxin [Paenibacillus lemnae]